MVLERYPATSTKPRNLILARMPEDQYKNIARYLVPVDLPLGMPLSTPNEPIEFLYFPVAGIISIDALTHSGDSVEVGVIGREGLAGFCGLLDQPQMAHSVVVQVAGSGLRMPLAPMRDEFHKGGPFASVIHSFLYQQMVQMAQSVLCNRIHAVNVRLARWLLTAADRVGSDSVQLTHEFLAQMLGSQRSTVTVAAGDLQREGLIEYKRGRITILNRPALESKACECYHIVRATYERLVTPFL